LTVKHLTSYPPYTCSEFQAYLLSKEDHLKINKQFFFGGWLAEHTGYQLIRIMKIS